MGQQTDEIMQMVNNYGRSIGSFATYVAVAPRPLLAETVYAGQTLQETQLVEIRARLLALESAAYPALPISHNPGTSDFLSIQTDFDGNDLG